MSEINEMIELAEKFLGPSSADQPAQSMVIAPMLAISVGLETTKLGQRTALVINSAGAAYASISNVIDKHVSDPEAFRRDVIENLNEHRTHDVVH